MLHIRGKPEGEAQPSPGGRHRLSQTPHVQTLAERQTATRPQEPPARVVHAPWGQRPWPEPHSSSNKTRPFHAESHEITEHGTVRLLACGRQAWLLPRGGTWVTFFFTVSLIALIYKLNGQERVGPVVPAGQVTHESIGPPAPRDPGGLPGGGVHDLGSQAESCPFGPGLSSAPTEAPRGATMTPAIRGAPPRWVGLP